MPDADAFRIEPVLYDTTLATGVQMGVADPAWLLSRQYVRGELAAEDAGSPAEAKLWLETSRLTRVAAGAPAGTGTPIDPGAPLEALVENEWQPRDGRPSSQLAALAGLQYRRELDRGVAVVQPVSPGPGVSVASYWTQLLAKYPLAPESSPLASFAAARVPDGLRLYADLNATLGAGTLPADPQVPADAVTLVTDAARRFVAWFAATSARELPEGGAWVPERLEYQMSVAAPTSHGELVLTATGYDSGRLDWYAFDVAPGASLGASQDTTAVQPAAARTLLPAPVTFRGMPAARLWEFEDAAADLGALRAEPEDLAAMLVLEFALTYGNEFFLVPVQLAVGSVSNVGALIVTDTFGQRTLISAAADIDGGLRLFQHFIPGSAPAEAAMIVFPAAPDGPESAPIEDVVLARDEGANVCWAIEKTTIGPSGVPEDRAELAAQQGTSAPAPPGSDALRYVLRTRVAGNWYPLLPLAGKAGLLRLGSEAGQSDPSGRVLEELTELPVEEVTRDGHRIVRVWRYARGADGAPYLWIGRRSGPAAETGASGLRFDLTERAPG